MDEHPSRLKAFLDELKRRKVYRVAVGYSAIAFIVWQAAEIAFPALGLPDSALTFVVVASILGFPVAVVLAWIYELRPDAGDGTGPEAVGRRLGGWPLAAGIVVLAGAGFAAHRMLRPGGEAPVGTRIAVFPLHTLSPGGETLGEGVAELISVGLDGAPGFTVVDPRSLWPPLLRASASPLGGADDNQFAETSRRFGASHFVTGTVLEAGGTLQVALRVYAVDGDAPMGSIRASAPGDSLGPLVDQLTVDLMASLWRGDEVPAVGRVDQHATSSPQALAAYLEAMSHARHGRFDEAQEAIERAVTADSTFALAHLAHFRIRSWTLSLNNQPYVGLREIIDRAMAYRDRLTPRNRLRVEAARAQDDTDAGQAAILYERIVEMDPADAGAWAGLAALRAQRGWMVRTSVLDALPTVQRAIALDSASVPLRYLLGVHHLLQGDHAGAREDARVMEALNPGGVLPGGFGSGLSVVAVPEAAVDSVLRAVTARDPGVVLGAIRISRMVDLDRARRLATFLRDSADQIGHRRLGYGAMVQLEGARGAASLVDSMAHGPAAGAALAVRVHRYLVAMTLAGMGDEAVARHAAEELRPLAPVDSLAWALENRMEAWAAAWALGAWHGALGDTVQANAYRDALTGLEGGGVPPRWNEALAADVEARVAARRGDTAAALAAASRAYELWTIHNADEGEWHPEPAIRYHLATQLQGAGRAQDAEWLYRSFQPPHWASFYTTLSGEALAQEPAR